MASGPRVMNGAAVSGRLFGEPFGPRSVHEGPVEELLFDAFRLAEMYALEYGVSRNSFLSSRRRPRLSLFSADYPKPSAGPTQYRRSSSRTIWRRSRTACCRANYRGAICPAPSPVKMNTFTSTWP